jgi:hypothetical protein
MAQTKITTKVIVPITIKTYWFPSSDDDDGDDVVDDEVAFVPDIAPVAVGEEVLLVATRYDICDIDIYWYCDMGLLCLRDLDCMMLKR